MTDGEKDGSQLGKSVGEKLGVILGKKLLIKDGELDGK